MLLPRYLIINGERYLLALRSGESKYVRMLSTRTNKPVWVTRERAKRRPDKYKPLDKARGPATPTTPVAMPPGESKYIRVMHKAKDRPVWVTRERYQKKPHKYEVIPVSDQPPEGQPNKKQFDTATEAARQQALSNFRKTFKGKLVTDPNKNPHRPKVLKQFARTQKLLQQHGRALKFGLGPRVVHWEPNPDYDPKKDDQMVGRVVNEDGSVERKYTQSYTKRNNLGKFVNYPEVAKTVDPFLRRVKKDLRSKNPKKRMLAFGAALTEDTLIRSGTPKKGDDKGAIGLTQLRKRNVRFGRDKKTGQPYFQIEYVGKTGVEHFGPDSAKVTNPHLVKMMRQTLQGKHKDEKIFTTPAGRPLTPTHLNRYLKHKGFAGTNKTFRYVKGTGMAQNLFETNPPPPEALTDQKAFDAWYEHHIVYPVSKKLGHKVKDRDEKTGRLKKKLKGSRTTRAHYIDLNLQAAHYKQHGFKLPDHVANHMREFVEKKQAKKKAKQQAKGKPVRKVKRAAEFQVVEFESDDVGAAPLSPEMQHMIEVFHTVDPEAAALPELPYLDPEDPDLEEEDDADESD